MGSWWLGHDFEPSQKYPGDPLIEVVSLGFDPSSERLAKNAITAAQRRESHLKRFKIVAFMDVSLFNVLLERIECILESGHGVDGFVPINDE